MKFEHCPELCWMPVRTKPRQEKKLKEYCAAHGVECYLPLLRKLHHYGKRTVEFMLPMFPGYVFCLLSEDIYRTITISNAVLYRINIDEKGEVCLLKELASIRAFEELVLNEDIVVKPELVAGTPVEISTGPFKGITGIIEYRKNKTLITVNVEILGQSASVEVDADSLEPIGK
ncbi:MAG: transcription termination/antitermination NusG family protein [Lentisphaerota bacterium]